MQYVLFPGRHHLLTRFQTKYLKDLAGGLVNDLEGQIIEFKEPPTVIFAVTSWDRSGTRRNPLPGHRREAAIENLAANSGLPVLVCPIPHVNQTDRFDEVIVNSIDVYSRGQIIVDPESTLVACSTPEVFRLFDERGFRIATVELISDSQGDRTSFSVRRPWNLVESIAAEGTLLNCEQELSPSSIDILNRYQFVPTIVELFADPLLGDEGDLTETRDYVTYASSFDRGADRKFELVRDLVRPGRIVDIGCGTGALLQKLASAPELAESDLFGIEAARPLFEICEHRRTMGAFQNENTFFYHRNVLNSPVLAANSVDTTITMALTHEVISYLSLGKLDEMIQQIHSHTRPGGVWINADVCAPNRPNEIVEFDLKLDNGVADESQTPTFEMEDAKTYLDSLSTWGRWLRFVKDFRAAEQEPVEWELVEKGTARATRRVLYEFLSKKDYTESWLSEMHERFCTLAWQDWVDLIQRHGFTVGPGSRPYTNDWIIENRFRPVCNVRTLEGTAEGFGYTHMVLVAQIPGSGLVSVNSC